LVNVGVALEMRALVADIGGTYRGVASQFIFGGEVPLLHVGVHAIASDGQQSGISGQRAGAGERVDPGERGHRAGERLESLLGAEGWVRYPHTKHTVVSGNHVVKDAVTR